MFRFLRAVLVVALAASCVWASAGLASAGVVVGYQVVEKTVSLPAGGFVRTDAVCPSGTVALGGGAKVVGAGSANFGTVVRESAPGSNTLGSLWLVAVSNTSSTSRTLGVFVVCGDAPAGYQVVQDNVSLPAGGFVGTDAAFCPGAEDALAGGAEVVGDGSADFNTVLQGDGSGLNTGYSVWGVSESNDSTSNYTLGIFAVCAQAPTGYAYVQNNVSLPAGGFVRDSADCPTGTVVLGGGAGVIGEGAGNFETEVQESAPDKGSAGSLWLAAVSNHSSTNQTLGIFAICATA